MLSDFGCARVLLPRGHDAAEEEPLTPDFVTLWYRAPEILLCHSEYDLPIDVWSLGITLTETEKGSAPFQNGTQIGMLFDIFKAVGPCAPELCLGTMGTVSFPTLKPCGGCWGQRYGAGFHDLINAMLKVAPRDRVTAHEALFAPWLQEHS